MLKKCLPFLLFAFAFLIFAHFTPAAAAGNKAVELPKEADTKDVVSLGKAKDPKSGRQLQGFAIISRVNKTQAPQSTTDPLSSPQTATPGASTQAASSPTCYGFFGAGAKWKTQKPFVLNPQNSRGLSAEFLLSTQSANVAKWEDAADGTLGNGVSKDILGEGSISDQQMQLALDGQNSVFFAQNNIQGAAVITQVWGFWDGPLRNRELVEWDQAYNDVDFDWSQNGEPGKVDFENASTHELGHAMGLTDQADAACSNVTMFREGSLGETSKRSLEAQDVTGMWQLYVDPTVDTDRDGFADYREQYIGTNPFAACGANAFPPDVNSDGKVNSIDLMIVAMHYGFLGDAKYAPRFDMNASGTVNSSDLQMVAQRYGFCKTP